MEVNEKFIERDIAELCVEYSKIHGANINIARIAPDLIDGLKPVQRRSLYIMFLKDQGKNYRKLATISGDVFGRVHPHSPVAIEDAIVGIAQEWQNNIPLIQGYGNFGAVSGDRAGASRYIQARLSEYATACFFEDWKDSVVDMVDAYDDETEEPLFLPAKYPNILLNGTLGIGYGSATNLPAYNFKEIVDACIMLMHNPNANVVLIPDCPTGADIIENDFARICNNGRGIYSMRCKYEVDPENNIIRITALPYQVYANNIRERIAEIKEAGGLAELISMNDLSGKETDIRLGIRHDINPYKFMKKLIKEVAGLEKSYPVNITVTNDFQSFDLSISELLREWIKYRREQKRTVITHKRTRLLSEQRTNDVKIFLMSKSNLDDTIMIFRTSRNRAEIERRLVDTYKNSEIRMDSLQARALSDMRMIELSLDMYEECLKYREDLIKQLQEVEDILNTDNGIDKVIIGELRDGSKRFGYPRRSNVVPKKISTESEISGSCILQLSADGNIFKRVCTNIDEEPIPSDSNGFAVKVENDSSFILVDDTGHHSFIKVADVPIDAEVPVNRYSKRAIGDNIIAMLPYDIESPLCCTLISKFGILKRFIINELGPSRKPCIKLSAGDKIVKGIVTAINSAKDILIYTDEGMGQRLNPNTVRITHPLSQGTPGFKFNGEDAIAGCFSIIPGENQYLLYTTAKGKMRLNNLDYLESRTNKHDDMVKLITLNDRDKLVSVLGCNRMDNVIIFYEDGTNETLDISKIPESTMSAEPVKYLKANMQKLKVVKVRIV